MSRTFKIAVLLAGLCLVTSAAAQKNETTTTKTTQRSGVVEAVYGNKVVLKDADGTHEYTVPEGFHFQMDGKKITVAELKPGMKVEATITEQTTTRDVVVTRNVTGQVMQVAPGGIILKDSSGKLTSYGSQDVQGKDVTIVRNGRAIPVGQLRRGDNLTATIVTTLPPQVVTEKSVSATVTPAPEPGAKGTGGSSTTEPSTTPPPAK